MILVVYVVILSVRFLVVKVQTRFDKAKYMLFSYWILFRVFVSELSSGLGIQKTIGFQVFTACAIMSRILIAFYIISLFIMLPRDDCVSEQLGFYVDRIAGGYCCLFIRFWRGLCLL